MVDSMTPPPAAGLGQALPARVVEAIEAFEDACMEGAEAAVRGGLHTALIAAIADAIEMARVAERDKWYAHEGENT